MAAAQLPVASLDRVTRYRMWKDNHVPLVYDWLSSRRLTWPHAAVQWGRASRPLEDRPRDRPLSAPSYSTRSIYLAERTGSGARDPNTLLQFDVRVVHELTSKPAEVAKPWHDDPASSERDHPTEKSFVLRKRLVHPGEVNRIRVIASNVVVTHSDCPQLYVWDFSSQPDRRRGEIQPHTPTVQLVGHSSNAEYALDVARRPLHSGNGDEPMAVDDADVWVLSGGSDRAVLLWRLADYETTGQRVTKSVRMPPANEATGSGGHSDTVEGVSFNARDRNLLVSVGRDHAVLLWDIRAPQSPTAALRRAHQGDVNCCDFGGVDAHKIVTGGNDALVKVWDARKLTAGATAVPTALRTLAGHEGEVQNVMWNRQVDGVIASGGEDGEVLLWRVTDDSTDAGLGNSALLFRHVGHGLDPSKIVDLDWLPSESDPWCLASLSERVGEGGSTLQIWRISDLIHRSKDDVAEELRAFQAASARP